MNRRRFVGGISALAVLAAAGCSRRPAESAAMPATAAGSAGTCGAIPAGVQLFTVRELLQRDPRAAFAALREIGIVDAELYGLNGDGGDSVLGVPARELRAIANDAGMSLTFSHMDGSLRNPSRIAELAHALGLSTVIVALPDEFTAMRDGRRAMVAATSIAQLDALADKLNRVGEEFRAQGLQFAYHNHHVEFMPVEGIVPYDYLMGATDPALVKIELDLGWLAASGRDPVAEIERHSGRVVSCHMKDFDARIEADVPQRQLVEPGAGGVDFMRVLEAMYAAGITHGFIEIDLTSDPLGAIGRGRRHLDAVAGCVAG